jgi:HEAT repeat protein
MSDERAISPLKTLLEDENGYMSEEAKKAIEKIQNKQNQTKIIV